MASATNSSDVRYKHHEEERRIAFRRCFAAIDEKDIDQFRASFQAKSLQQDDVVGVLQATVRAGWMEGTRFLLAERGNDPMKINLESTLKDTDSLDMFKLLADYGLDFQSNADQILMHVMERPDILDWLLAQGVDINKSHDRRRYRLKKGERDDTCGVLNEAAAEGNIDLFEHLVARGADPSRSIALHMASFCKDPVKTTAMMNYLVDKHHFDINTPDHSGGLLKLMTECTEDGPPLNYAITYRNIAAMEFLRKRGVYFTVPAFHKALSVGFEPALKLFLDAGVDPSECLIQIPTQDGPSEDRRLPAAKLCLEHGGDPTPAIMWDRAMASNDAIGYDGMSDQMKILLDEWKAKWDAEGKKSDLSKVNELIQLLPQEESDSEPE